VTSTMVGIVLFDTGGGRMQKAKNPTTFIVPNGLKNYVQDAIDRLSYLYPDVDFSITGQNITIASLSEIDRKKLNEELRYALYRSKIRAESDADRTALFSAVFSK
jgi:hypothetical protein